MAFASGKWPTNSRRYIAGAGNYNPNDSSDSDPYANTDSYADPYSYSYYDPYANTDSALHTYTNPDSDPYTDSDAR